MNLTSDTVAILKNFSDINQNILVKPGNQLQTISTLKNILAQADVTEKFDQEFAIYDLPEFLRAVDLFDKSDLKFNGGQNLTIADGNSKQSIKYYFADKSVVVAPTKMINMPDKYVTFSLKKDVFAKLMKGVTTLNLPDISVTGDGKQSIKYYFADKSVVVAPTKMINMPDKFVTFSLKKDVFEKLMKGVTTLNLPDIAVTGDGKEIKLVATDKKTPSSNDYSLVIGETDKTFKAYFKTENFKMIRDDYDVAISSQKISHFINRNKPIQYWIAIEPDSEF